LKDLTNATSSDADLGGNKYLYVKMTDNGEPGVNDIISFVLVNGTDNPTFLEILFSQVIGLLIELSK